MGITRNTVSCELHQGDCMFFIAVVFMGIGVSLEI